MGQQAGQQASAMGMLFPLLYLAVIFYFFIPQAPEETAEGAE